MEEGGARACMLPACSSFCLVPAQIWYSAVDTTAPPPTAQPSRLLPICAVAAAPRQRTPAHAHAPADAPRVAAPPQNTRPARPTCRRGSAARSSGCGLDRRLLPPRHAGRRALATAPGGPCATPGRNPGAGAGALPAAEPDLRVRDGGEADAKADQDDGGHHTLGRPLAEEDRLREQHLCAAGGACAGARRQPRGASGPARSTCLLLPGGPQEGRAARRAHCTQAACAGCLALRGEGRRWPPGRTLHTWLASAGTHADGSTRAQPGRPRTAGATAILLIW